MILTPSEVASIESHDELCASHEELRGGFIDLRKQYDSLDSFYKNTIQRLHDRMDGLESELERKKTEQYTRWQADMRAIRRWHEAGGCDMNFPGNHDDLVVWLLGKLEDAERNIDTAHGWMDEAVGDYMRHDRGPDSLRLRCESAAKKLTALREAVEWFAYNAPGTPLPDFTDAMLVTLAIANLEDKWR